jgi:hypothetical protein
LAEGGGSLVTAKAEFVIPSVSMARKMMSDSDIESFRDFFRNE